MQAPVKKYSPSTLISLALTVVIVIWGPSTPWINTIHWKIYDGLMKAKAGFTPPAAQINDILLVMIDNSTIQNMEHSWPYPRADFAQVIANLKKANPKIIAFDFAFYGASSEENDNRLAEEISAARIILPSTINEDGSLSSWAQRASSKNVPTGIVTKILDKDGITRRNLTYVVNESNRLQGFLSWEMQILRYVKSVDFSNFVSHPNLAEFKNSLGEKWSLSLDPDTNAFLINFRAHTQGFKRLSFYDVYRGNFEPRLVKGKIVLVGLFSSLLGDIHNTPIGWIPGSTLNANAFLTLYSHDFLRPVARFWEILAILAGVISSCFLINHFTGKWPCFFILFEILIFIFASYGLLRIGYFWDYFLFPLAVFAAPYFGKKIAEIFKLI
ncbi:MAG: hypothetical protein COX96_06485 [Candidatus Omnitrophica bacterium CG_4_10_14_0_2_um_filter_44_9]|nr:MAG: hypothetical protein COY78_08735 [Candidatus Omnitrophica bacterium CG_4_10_14_0_8_um_filter_44_12]PIZ83873.1 MAG: hypothetical protein COX96_06485 [Candidatus Omnitrophica bacterium CG_4_10_14_0_2_um_filter_44_9]